VFAGRTLGSPDSVVVSERKRKPLVSGGLDPGKQGELEQRRMKLNLPASANGHGLTWYTPCMWCASPSQRAGSAVAPLFLSPWDGRRAYDERGCPPLCRLSSTSAEVFLLLLLLLLLLPLLPLFLLHAHPGKQTCRTRNGLVVCVVR